MCSNTETCLRFVGTREREKEREAKRSKRDKNALTGKSSFFFEVCVLYSVHC
jgi:hypothetical protein